MQAGRARSAGAQSIKRVMEVDGNVEEAVSHDADEASTAIDAVAPFLKLMNVGDYSIPKKRKHC